MPTVSHTHTHIRVQIVSLARLVSGGMWPITTAEPAAPPPVLSADQQCMIDLVMAGRSLFFTGAAGTGKSTFSSVDVCRGFDSGV